MKFEELVDHVEKLRKTRSKNEKIKELSKMLKKLKKDEIKPYVALLLGHFPPLDIGFGSIKRVKPGQSTLYIETPTIEEVYSDLLKIAKERERSKKIRVLEAIFSKLSREAREFLISSLLGEVRIGVEEGLMLEAIARASGLRKEVKRAYMFRDIKEVAELALTQPKELRKISIEIFSPVRPMLAEDSNLEDALKKSMALEYKYDGARVQVHKSNGKIKIFSRRLKDITEYFPEIIEIVKEFPDELILEGEIIAFKDKPLPFQFLMRRYRRIHERQRIFNEIPVKIFFFDVLYFKQSLIEKAYEKRRKILETIVKNHASKQIIPYSLGKAKKFLDQAINEGHEGLIAKELKSKYEPGKRSKAWLKIKPFITLDLVIIAAEWGHGRRKGWLSNYHLAARDREGYAMLGKTFKGLTDEEFEYLTQRLLSIKIKEEGNVVYVKPEVVVEVAFNEIQKSRQYPSGFALRFARIVGIREDKSPEEIDTLDKVKSIAGFEAPYEA